MDGSLQNWNRGEKCYKTYHDRLPAVKAKFVVDSPNNAGSNDDGRRESRVPSPETDRKLDK
jgi:hypothetical protein